jgi:hypothetical protein
VNLSDGINGGFVKNPTHHTFATQAFVRKGVVIEDLTNKNHKSL